MRDNYRDVQHFILAASNADSFNEALRHSVPEQLFVSLEFRRTGVETRRRVLERKYEIVVIHIPLPDENGLELAIDIAEKNGASVIVSAPEQIYENVLEYVTDHGILVLPRPVPKGRIGKALRLLLSFQNRIRSLEMEIDRTQARLEELRYVSRAKILLMEKRNMTEDEAHRYIGKQAMDHGISRRRVAEEILEEEIRPEDS